MSTKPLFRFLLGLALAAALTGGWRTGPARAARPAAQDAVRVWVSPGWVRAGGAVRLEAQRLQANRKVEAGLRIASMGREVVRAAWTDGQGKLALTLTLPATAAAGETWQGVVRVADGEQERVYLSANTLLVAPEPFTYRVRPGDTLGEIAGWFGTTIEDILEANPGLGSGKRIVAGQRLAIRVGSAAGAPAARRPGYRIPDGDGPGLEQSLARGALGEVWEEIGGRARWIEIDLSSQTARAFQGTKLARRFVVSTGRASTPTVTGKFRIYVKHQAVDMSGPGYHVEDVPFTMYFYKGYGLHGATWHNNFGRRMSHGCVNFRLEDAEWLFGFAEVGTLVYVHE